MKTLLLFATFVCGLILSSCGTQYVMTDRGPQAYYQTGFPVHDTSRELDRIFQSVKRINVTGYYDTYVFSLDDRITRRDVDNDEIYKRPVDRFTFDYSKAGTATILFASLTSAVLITNNHVVHFPDTVVQYYGDDRPDSRRRAEPRYVESVSIKKHQTNIVYDAPQFGTFEVLAQDATRDIALIGIQIADRQMFTKITPLKIKSGDPAKLQWGSFTYVLGYPKGFKMVTRAIVSDPRRDRMDSFLLDGLFNEGISGGLILAVRGDTGELEWVGMARGGSASTEFVLVPDRSEADEHETLLPYEGKLYIQTTRRIDYGITFSVSMKSITSFLRENKRELRIQGYFLPSTFFTEE